jgi:predicted AAA+ superfamily ATPase
MKIQRSAIQDLALWYKSSKRKPLIIRGARQVGKSTLIKNFALKQGLNLIEINLEEKTLNSFLHPNIDIQKIISEIELNLGRKIVADTDLIFIDEIQKSKNALMSLRYFYEKYPHLAVVAAGSLLDLVLNDEDVSFPVGRVEFYQMGPVRFSEFLMASENLPLIETWSKPLHQITNIEHEKLNEFWRYYIIVGGMPEAVSEFYDSNFDFLIIKKIHKNLLSSFRADILKYAKKNQLLRCSRVFDWTTGHIGQKVKFSEIDSDEKARDLKVAIETLVHARVVSACYHTQAMQLPLSASRDEKIFKLYFLDCGLVSTSMDFSFDSYLTKENAYNGPLMEQAVVQNLLTSQWSSHYSDQNLFYWLKDKNPRNAEVDLIAQVNDKIIPIEIKAGTNTKSKSLMVFKETHPNCKNLILVSMDPFKAVNHQEGHFKKIYLPGYAVEKLDTIVD